MNGRRVLLGVTGGIAAYKAAALASRLVQAGVVLDVVMTADALKFVGEATFAALARRPVHTSLWERVDAIPHIALARENDVIAIVPATANTIAKLALGIADDLLTNVALATRAPLLLAPAMNTTMLEHEATRAHLATLRARGATIVEPGVGFLAEREHGAGRLADEDALIAAIASVLRRTNDLAGEHVLITAGPTREPIDPVRFLSNAATGTQGLELAREALARGAQVDLVLGPTSLEPPAGARTTHVTTAREMDDAVRARAFEATIAIATAAVADWRPAVTHEHKVKKTDDPQTLALERNPDILANLGANKNGLFLVGFAAETEAFEANAREKLVRKHLDAIAVNDVSGERGFGGGENALVLLWGTDGRRDLGRGSKRELAIRLWDAIVELRGDAR
ncbi:MAG: bifunctional phosphopantothenoylcysteine decarboxylase/phosphopantothenate--cysteine ligase CoaBC [Candidatus Eremiobacteraeota bacterium]|nr:bifunctional phosphopantothenoylcysteine decarboxylase/phosphopantothenate--cysteine ligase CoaBC [Candidatus Eremiobacteraeota bacterium]